MGFADRLDADGLPARDATVVPYTERRLEALLEWLWGPDSGYHVDRDRVYLYGGSMGGSGALSFGLRHPGWFAAIYALLPMTNPQASTWGRPGLASLWGPVTPPLRAADGPSIQARLDMQRFLEAHAGEDLPFTVTIHGRTDTTIEWKTQGRPWLEARERAALPGPALFTDGDHSSTFDSYTSALVPNYDPTAYALRRTDSYPVFTGFTGDDPLDAPLPVCRAADRLYRYGYRGGALRWGGTGQKVLGRAAPIDTPTRYEIALDIRQDLCAIPSRGTTSITLRRRQAFRPPTGALVRWENVDARGRKLQAGVVHVGPGDRLTIPAVQVSIEGSVLKLTSASR
jgi:pimeloyl-ACP methyl ester carboxylesterase